MVNMSTAVMPSTVYDLGDLVLKGEGGGGQMAAMTVDLEAKVWGGSDHHHHQHMLGGGGSTSPPHHHQLLLTGGGTGGSSSRSSLPLSFPLAALLDNLLTNTHRRLDRSQSEPSPGASNSSSSSSSTSKASLINTSRYKTELCRPFEENGVCKYGDKCQFAHGESELRGLVRHPKYKTELCRTFHTVGFCPYGPRCHFIHNAEEARIGKMMQVRPLSPPSSSCSSSSTASSSSPPPPPLSPDSRLPVFNRISSVPNSPPTGAGIGLPHINPGAAAAALLMSTASGGGGPSSSGGGGPGGATSAPAFHHFRFNEMLA